MAGSNLPKYNSAIADMLNWPPTIKMDFPRVGMRFYPLRADLARLQRSSAILKRDVQAIDMRLPDRLVVRVVPEPPKEAPTTKKGRLPAKNT